MPSFRSVLVVLAALLLAAAAGISFIPTAGATPVDASGMAPDGSSTHDRSHSIPPPEDVGGSHGEPLSGDVSKPVSVTAPSDAYRVTGISPVGVVAGAIAITAIAANLRH
ncbi:hypothetical protein [Haloarchaeobius sp. DFWS5]|uniref:hypothetical protein n=1 Tax=Haloarchaeobius sp. DFWS5 TaxID=3446114 RepID=UPI003EC0AF1D